MENAQTSYAVCAYEFRRGYVFMIELIAVIVIAIVAVLISLKRINDLKNNYRTVSARCRDFRRGSGKNSLYVTTMEYTERDGVLHTTYVYLVKKPQIGAEYTIFLNDENLDFTYSTEDITICKIVIAAAFIGVLAYFFL